MIVFVVGDCLRGGLFVLGTASRDYTLQAYIGSIHHNYLPAFMVNFNLKFWIHSIFVFVLQCVIHRCGFLVCVVVHFSFIKLRFLLLGMRLPFLCVETFHFSTYTFMFMFQTSRVSF